MHNLFSSSTHLALEAAKVGKVMSGNTLTEKAMITTCSKDKWCYYLLACQHMLLQYQNGEDLSANDENSERRHDPVQFSGRKRVPRAGDV